VRSAEISVIVATRERPERLEQCIRGVLDGEVLPAEIVVVDQSPAPPPVGIAADRVQLVVVRDGCRGLSRARNLALRAARNPVVAVLDDDCVPSPGWLSAIDRELGDGSVDAVAGPVLPLPPEGSERHAVSSRRSLEPRTYTGTAAPWRVGTGGNFAVRSARLRELGGYDERLGAGTAAMAGEDLDLIHRLLRGGARIAYVPAALVSHSRADATRRRATRSGYGRGAGTFIGLRLRARDASAAAVLGRWIVDRAALLGRAVVRADSNAAVEELLVLGGTAAGLADGLRGAR
jgi:GT2 family glycosyltransferase